MASSPGSEDGDIGFQIAPMVDVVFVLLLFFMASAGMRAVEKEINIKAPNRGPGDPQPPIHIRIDGNGAVSMNEQYFGAPGDQELQALRSWLQGALADFKGTSPVILDPAPEVRHSRLVDVLQAVASAKVQDGKQVLTFQTITFR